MIKSYSYQKYDLQLTNFKKSKNLNRLRIGVFNGPRLDQTGLDQRSDLSEEKDQRQDWFKTGLDLDWTVLRPALYLGNYANCQFGPIMYAIMPNAMQVCQMICPNGQE